MKGCIKEYERIGFSRFFFDNSVFLIPAVF